MIEIPIPVVAGEVYRGRRSDAGVTGIVIRNDTVPLATLADGVRALPELPPFGKAIKPG